MPKPSQSDVIIVNDYKYRIKRDGESVLVMRWLLDGSESSAERVIDRKEIPPRVMETFKGF